MLKCQSTCPTLVFVLKKTLQALDDMPKDYLHNKRDSFALLKVLTNIKGFFSGGGGCDSYAHSDTCLSRLHVQLTSCYSASL